MSGRASDGPLVPSHHRAMRSAKSSSTATASVASPANSVSVPRSHPTSGSESSGVSASRALGSAGSMKRRHASSDPSTYCHPNEKMMRLAMSGTSGSIRTSPWSHHGSFDGSSSRASSSASWRRRSRESEIPSTMSAASAKAMPLARSSESGTSTRSRTAGSSSDERGAASRATSARRRPAPATTAAPGIVIRLIGGATVYPVGQTAGPRAPPGSARRKPSRGWGPAG